VGREAARRGPGAGHVPSVAGREMCGVIRVGGLWIEVWGSGFDVQRLGFKVWGLIDQRGLELWVWVLGVGF